MGEESFTAEKMRYNFVKRKGIIFNAVTKEERDLTIHGDMTKFVAGGVASGQEDDILYAKGALITTCDHSEPHFGIRAQKVKTIPDKLAVIGASNFEFLGPQHRLFSHLDFIPSQKPTLQA